jgi:hypothetical protein
MKSILVYGITGLALAVACTAQTNSQPTKSTSSNAPAVVGDLVDDTIRGIGIPGTVPLFIAPRTLGNSVIIQDVTGGIGIGTGTASGVKLAVGGNLSVSGNVSAPQYNIGSERVLSVSGYSNLFVGSGAGAGNSGYGNTFVGYNAAGAANSGANNSVFGVAAGLQNTTGANNSYFGSYSGQFNVAGSRNSYFGSRAGLFTNGSDNAFFGYGAGENVSSGSNNTFLGAGASATAGVTNATAIGSRAFAESSNTLILGGVSSVNGGSSVNVGIGVTSPNARLEVGGDVYISTLSTSSASPGGLILRNPNGLCARLTLNNSGALSVSGITCPGSTGL